MKSGDFISGVEPGIPRTDTWLLTTPPRWRVLNRSRNPTFDSRDISLPILSYTHVYLHFIFIYLLVYVDFHEYLCMEIYISFQIHLFIFILFIFM